MRSSLLGVRGSARALKGLKAVLVDPGDKGGVVLANDAALHHHVNAVYVEGSRMRVLWVMMTREPSAFLR